MLCKKEVNTPWHRRNGGGRLFTMKMHPHPQTPLTLGEFIMHAYDVCAVSQAAAIVRLALETQRVLLRGNPRSAWQPGRSAHTRARALRSKTVAKVIPAPTPS